MPSYFTSQQPSFIDKTLSKVPSEQMWKKNPDTRRFLSGDTTYSNMLSQLQSPFGKAGLENQSKLNAVSSLETFQAREDNVFQQGRMSVTRLMNE